MNRLPARAVRVIVPGVPPNWGNRRGHHLALAAEKAVWRNAAWILAASARNAARWPAPVKCDPPARRYLEIAVYRRRLGDHDGVLAALKPIIDGACARVLPLGAPRGILAWDDSPAWLAFITPPCDMQHVVATAGEERVELVVHLDDPR